MGGHQDPPPQRGQDQGEQGARRRDQELTPGRGWLLLDLGEAAQRVEQDPAHRQPEAPGDQGVAQLVDQDGDPQQHHEGGGHHVPDPARASQRRAVPVQEDEQASDQEPVRRDVHGYPEGPRDPHSGARPLRRGPFGRCACHRSMLRAGRPPRTRPPRPEASQDVKQAAKRGNCRRLPLLSLAWPTMVCRSLPRLNQARPARTPPRTRPARTRRRQGRARQGRARQERARG